MRRSFTVSSLRKKESRQFIRNHQSGNTNKMSPASEDRKREVRPDRWAAVSKFVRAINGPTENDDDYDSSDSSSDDENEPPMIIGRRTWTIVPLDQSKRKVVDVCSPKSTSRISSKLVNTPEIPARHAYPNRGHSKSSLLHQKSFWHDRYEEWIAWQAQFDFENAYGGI